MKIYKNLRKDIDEVDYEEQLRKALIMSQEFDNDKNEKIVKRLRKNVYVVFDSWEELDDFYK